MGDSELSEDVPMDIEPAGEIPGSRQLHPFIASLDESMRQIFMASIVFCVLFTIVDSWPLLVGLPWERIVPVALGVLLMVGMATILTFVLDMGSQLIVKSVAVLGMWILLYGCAGYTVYRIAFEAGQALQRIFPYFREHVM